MMKLLGGGEGGVCRCGVGVCKGWTEGREGDGRCGLATRYLAPPPPPPSRPLPSIAALPPVTGVMQGSGVGRLGYTGVLWVDRCLQSIGGKVERVGVDMVQHHDVQTPPPPPHPHPPTAWCLRRPPRERRIPGSNPTCDGIFPRSSHTSDLIIGTPVATLPGAWRYRVSAGTGWPGVSIL